jgi:hypothetical protein
MKTVEFSTAANGECDDHVPDHAKYTLDRKSALDIMLLARMVDANQLLKLEKLSGHVDWIFEEDLVDDRIVSDGLLHVDSDLYWFTAIVSNRYEIFTDVQPVRNLMDHFDIDAGGVLQAEIAAADAFLSRTSVTGNIAYNIASLEPVAHVQTAV